MPKRSRTEQLRRLEKDRVAEKGAKHRTLRLLKNSTVRLLRIRA